VQSVLKPAPKQVPGQAKSGSTDTNQARLPGLLKQDEPTSVTSGELEYSGDAHRAVYSGGVRLWQAATTIKSDRMVLDDDKGDLTASGSVVWTMLPTQTNDKTKQKEQVSSMEVLHASYEDAVACDLHDQRAARRSRRNLTGEKIGVPQPRQRGRPPGRTRRSMFR
jgi:hypothetical protein